MKVRPLFLAALCLISLGEIFADTPLRAEVAEVTFMVSPSDPARPAWQKLSDEFNRTHADIQFHILWSDLGPKLNLLTVAGALPDLIDTADINLIRLHDKLIDLDNFLNQLPEITAQYYPQLLQSCRFEGALKLIPIYYNVPFIYYRPDLFRKAGLPEPSSDWSWDDYRRDAKVLTERNPDGSVKIYGTNVQGWWYVEWLSLIRQAGGDAMTTDGKLEINSPATLQAVQFMHDLIYVDESAPKIADFPPGGFMSGKIAIYYGGHVLELSTLRDNATFEWDIAPLPVGSAGKATGDLAVEGLGISNQCKHPEAAFEVLRFLMSTPSAMALAEGGLSPPVRRDIAQKTILSGTPETRTIRPKHAEVLIDSLAFARSIPKLKVFGPVSTAINSGIVHALNDPDASNLAGLPAELESQCRVQMDLMKTKPQTTPILFVVQVLVIGGALWFLFRFLEKSRMTREEAAGQKYFFIFTAPCIAGLCLFTIWPLVLSFWWAQTDNNMIDSPHYVGLAQYRSLLFEDPDFWHSLQLSLVYAIFAVPLGLVVSLSTALLLNWNLSHIGIFRVIFYLPSILPAAASSMMWVWLLERNYGVVNQVLALFGIAGPGWLQDPHWALPALILISFWGFGGGMLIFLAGLKNIPESLYEAADIDGAGTLSKFIHITLPSLSPVLFFNLIMGCIGALQVFDVAYIISTSMGGEAGGPEKSTYFYVLNLYVKSFNNLEIGTGSAMAWLFFLVILAITGVNFWAKRYWFPPEDERS